PEVLHVRKQVFLGHGARRTGRNMHDPHAQIPIHLFRQIGIVQSCENVDAVAQGRQLARNIDHIDVLAATIDPSRLRSGRSMFANNSYPVHDHSPLDEPAAPPSRAMRIRLSTSFTPGTPSTQSSIACLVRRSATLPSNNTVPAETCTDTSRTSSPRRLR